jgi:urease accessory protein
MKVATVRPDGVAAGAFALAAGTLLAAPPALAHHPMGGATPQTFGEGLLSGLGHPVIGLDHLAFLLVAILLAAALKGSARFLVPLAFVGATVAGTVVHLGAATIPMLETLVALSIIVGGVLALTRRYPGALALAAVFAVSGILHGYAYGESIVGAEPTPLLAYLAGFATVQYALIAGGVLGLERLARHSEKASALLARGGGLVTLLAGGLFLTLSVA